MGNRIIRAFKMSTRLQDPKHCITWFFPHSFSEDFAYYTHNKLIVSKSPDFEKFVNKKCLLEVLGLILT